MQKDFDKWNEEKKILDERKTTPFCHPQEIWWSFLGLNVGSEQNGDEVTFKRPVLIIRIIGTKTCLVAPLTTSPNSHYFRVSIGKIGTHENKVILSQIKVIDTKRLISRIGKISSTNFENIRKIAKDLL